MKKEKKVKSYTRRTKSGKTVTVRAHTAKYDASDKEKGLSKKRGAGKELERKKVQRVPNMLDTDEWLEFENNFEEGWGGEPSVFCLANNAHHRKVANLAAYNLSKKYKGGYDELGQTPGWETIAQKAYNAAAKKLYPKEKLWSGDNENNPEFWKEHLRHDKSMSLSEKRKFWDTELWGPIPSEFSSSKKKPRR